MYRTPSRSEALWILKHSLHSTPTHVWLGPSGSGTPRNYIARQMTSFESELVDTGEILCLPLSCAGSQNLCPIVVHIYAQDIQRPLPTSRSKITKTGMDIFQKICLTSPLQQTLAAQGLTIPHMILYCYILGDCLRARQGLVPDGGGSC